MTITLSLTIKRPAHLFGRSNNFKLFTELVDMLDGIGTVESVAVNKPDEFIIHLCFQRPDDPMNEPLCDKYDAWNWAMGELVKELTLPIRDCSVLSFEPDQPPLTAKEREADRNLGDRPFSG